jgi:transcriptional regulator with XRE-family HTH domain
MTTALKQWLDGQPEGCIGELARAAEVGRRSVSRWAHGDGYPSLRSASRIAQATGLPLAALANPEDLKALADAAPDAAAALASPPSPAHKPPNADVLGTPVPEVPQEHSSEAADSDVDPDAYAGAAE